MGIKNILGGKALKSKKCPQCGFEARLEEGKSINELARIAQKDPRLSASDMSHLLMGGTKGKEKERRRIFHGHEVVCFIGATKMIFYHDAHYQEMKKCPRCETPMEDVPEGK